MPVRKKEKLTGRNTLRGENKVATLVMIRKNLLPSFISFILLFPFLFAVFIGMYLTVKPLRRYAIVRVVG